jgi:RNA polymerase sigma factor (sigma-70 family)
MRRTSTRGAFERVYRGAYPRVYRTLAAILSPDDAADATQDAFIRAFASWESWRRELPPEVVVHRIAVERASSYRRTARLRTVGALLRRIGRKSTGGPPDDDTRRSLVGALRTIHPKLAAAVVLRYYHGYTNREIASVIGVSERTVVNHLREASERLRAVLDDPREIELNLALQTGGLPQVCK